jgi:hypothetical protein
MEWLVAFVFPVNPSADLIGYMAAGASVGIIFALLVCTILSVCMCCVIDETTCEDHPTIPNKRRMRQDVTLVGYFCTALMWIVCTCILFLFVSATLTLTGRLGGRILYLADHGK